LIGPEASATLGRPRAGVEPPSSCPDGDLKEGHMTDKATNDQLQSFDSKAMPWGEPYIDQLKLGVPLKAFISDPDTSMSGSTLR
jgi:hypothetical protein